MPQVNFTAAEVQCLHFILASMAFMLFLGAAAFFAAHIALGTMVASEGRNAKCRCNLSLSQRMGLGEKKSDERTASSGTIIDYCIIQF